MFTTSIAKQLETEGFPTKMLSQKCLGAHVLLDHAHIVRMRREYAFNGRTYNRPLAMGVAFVTAAILEDKLKW